MDKKSNFIKIDVLTWYLKFTKQIPVLNTDFEVVQWLIPNVDEYLKLYNLVGEKWGWSGRLLMTDTVLKLLLEKPENEVWLFKKDSALKGFIEINFAERGKAEIVYFGLLPSEIGKGFGKAFLDAAIFIAARNGNVVWLHTCEYDHPKALEIYLKAGFEINKESIDNEFYSIDFLSKLQQ